VMPGPHGPWGEQLVAEVNAGTVDEADIDDKVARLIGLARRVGALNGSIDSDATEHAPAGSRALVDPALLRELTARSFVLLSNPRGLLPVRSAGVERLALIGPNAVEPQRQGGGSVRVLPVAGKDLADALGEALDAYVSVHQGCMTSATIAAPQDGSLHDPVSGEPGVRVEVRTADGVVVSDARFPTSVLTWWDDLPAAVHLPDSEVTMRARYRPLVDGPHVLGVAGVGMLRVSVDGTSLAEAKTELRRDSVQALSQPPELRVPLQLQAGRDVDLLIELRPNARGPHAGFASLRFGIAPKQEDDKLMAEAVVAAAGADVAVVVVGSADGTESEGYDRESMVLPGRQDELVRHVAAANPNTVVVVNSGMPVLMPWADEVAAIIQVWFPGQAFAEALADVLAGVAEPGGRLPISMPRAEADSPVLHATPQSGDLAYAEGLLVGYRGYDRRETEPLFGFGHGLGYTDWTYESLGSGSESVSAGADLSVVVGVRNSGRRAGREVVQVYLEAQDDDPRRPLRVLAAFGTVDGEPGTQTDVRLTVPARAFARYDDHRREWVWKPGTYTLRAGRSSRDLRLKAEVVLR
ncbi:MAG TPA: glycoside hydrolase family 3 C-terminal domain-containing protein, partial [Candidatus Dormibacteraeota bacterium]